MINELWSVTVGLNPADKWQLAGMRKPENLLEINSLKNNQVVAIISLLDNEENHQLYQDAQMPFLWLPVTGGAAMTSEQAKQAFAYIKSILSDKPQGIVAVHCSNGHKRTGMLLAAMKILAGAGVDKAVQEVTTANPGAVAMNTGQRDFLRNLAVVEQGGAR